MKTFCLLLLVFLFLSRPFFGQTITIGNSTVTTNNPDGNNAGLVCAQSATLSQSATIQSLSFYVTSPDGTLTLGVYDAAKQLVASTPTFTPVSGWNTQNVVAPVVLSPGVYWLAYVPSSNSLGFEVAPSGNSIICAPYSCGGMPSAFPTVSGAGSGQWCFYATLTPISASPTPTPSPTPSTGFQFAGGIFDLPSNPVNFQTYYMNNPYNAVTQPSADSLYSIIVNISTFNWGALNNVMALCRANNLHFTWYCGYINWAEQQNFPANYVGTGSNIVTLFTNLMSQAAARYPDMAQYCYFNYANEGLERTDLNPGTGEWESAFGGRGNSGIDWMINTGKVVRKYFPTAKIGINNFAIEAADGTYMVGYQQNSYLNTVLPALRALVSAGVLDFVGFEGYSLETISSSALTSALNTVGSLGTKVIYTEFSPGSYEWFSAGPGTISDAPQPDAGGTGYTQVSCWKRLFPLLATNQYCIGITGPWVGSPAGGSPIFSGNPPIDTPTMTWLKFYVQTLGIHQ